MYPSVVTECEKACMRRTTVPTSISWRFCCFLLWIARRAEKLAQTMNWANKTKQKRKKKSLSDLPLGLSRWHHKGERQPLKEKKKKKKHRSLWKRLLIIHKPPVAPFLHSTSTESVVCHLLKKKKGGTSQVCVNIKLPWVCAAKHGRGIANSYAFFGGKIS